MEDNDVFEVRSVNLNLDHSDGNQTNYLCEFCHDEKSFCDVWCDKHNMYHHFCATCFNFFDKVLPTKDPQPNQSCQ